MSKHKKTRHLPLDPAVRARVLTRARQIAEELTAALSRQLEAFGSEGPVRDVDAIINEGYEHLAQAVALNALARMARLKFDTPIEGAIIEQIAASLVSEVAG